MGEVLNPTAIKILDWAIQTTYFDDTPRGRVALRLGNARFERLSGPFRGLLGGWVRWKTEVPGSPVPEPKLRDSRFKSRLGTGLGIDIRAM